MFRVAIVTLSDKGAAGQRTDESGAVIREIAEQNGYEVVSYTLLPDEREQISAELRRLCDENVASWCSPRAGRIFPPATARRRPRSTWPNGSPPGIAEAMRYSSLNITKRAMLSRAVAVIRGGTLIVNLPGSPQGGSGRTWNT